MAHLLVEGHACDHINSREGICHRREGLTQRGRSEGELVSECKSTSVKKPRLVRFGAARQLT